MVMTQHQYENKIKNKELNKYFERKMVKVIARQILRALDT